MKLAHTQPSYTSDNRRRAAVLTKATLRAADRLGLLQRDLAVSLGLSEATVSRMRSGDYLLAGKEFELAAWVVRIFRSLDALMGGNTEAAGAWFHAENRHLCGVPADLIRGVGGLVRVAEYLDFMRGAQ